MRGLKKTKGITLIALIITIIVLLILAGITINLTIGQNGILKQAQNAGIKNEKAQLKEELELAILDIQTEKLSKGQNMKREYLTELDKIGAIVESTGIPAEGQYKDYGFEVDEEYRVTILDKVAGEKPSAQAVVVTQGIVAEGGTVEIKVTASISEGSITEIVATNGATLKTDTSATEKVFTVSTNGTYTFNVTADNGRSASASVEVNTIIEKPVIEIKDVTGTGFTIVVTNNYKEGLITEYKYYVSGTVKQEGTANKEVIVTNLAEDTIYENIYVEAYVGEQKLTSDVRTATTASIWNKIAKMAKLISDDNTITSDTSEVTKQIDGEDFKLAVGDTMTVKVNGTPKTVRIMGFNHDVLTDTSAYGEGMENTYAGISFEFVDCITEARMNATDTNSGGWAVCELRNTLNNTTINTLSNNSYIKEVEKSYISNPTSANSVTTCSDKLWLLSCSEIWPVRDNGYCGWTIAKEGERYKYYKNVNESNPDALNGLISKNNVIWWLRSPYYGSNLNQFNYVGASGNDWTANASSVYRRSSWFYNLESNKFL